MSVIILFLYFGTCNSLDSGEFTFFTLKLTDQFSCHEKPKFCKLIDTVEKVLATELGKLWQFVNCFRKTTLIRQQFLTFYNDILR